MIEQTALQPISLGKREEPFMPSREISRHLQVASLEPAAAALLHLWHDLDLGPDPLIFLGSRYSRHRYHQAFFLDKILERRHQEGFQHICGWTRLIPPSYAYGLAEIPLAGPLQKADRIREAGIYDRGAVAGPIAGWYRYDFIEGWSGLSVMLSPDHDGDAITITAIPQDRQDSWLAFLQALSNLHSELLHMERIGKIQVLGGRDEVVNDIRNVSFDDVILPSEILKQVASQRRIFSPSLLQRYVSFGIPRMRKVLLAGPPGTGKTTLLKAEAALHIQNGGYVIYVFAAKKADRSWELLSQAMESAAVSSLPTLILVEDFEQFVSNAEDPQQVLNTLDGVATPNNPAGTLILATTNAPERIDPRIKDRPGRIDMVIEVGLVECEDLVIRFLQRFLGDAFVETEHAPVAEALLKQPGSHIREVCLLATIRALDEDRVTILRDDLLWAHEAILDGRAIAAQPERFLPPSPKKLLNIGFGKKR